MTEAAITRSLFSVLSCASLSWSSARKSNVKLPVVLSRRKQWEIFVCGSVYLLPIASHSWLWRPQMLQWFVGVGGPELAGGGGGGYPFGMDCCAGLT